MFDNLLKFLENVPKDIKPLLIALAFTIPINYSVLYAIMDNFAGYDVFNRVVFTDRKSVV